MRLLEGSTWWWVGPWYILVVRFLEIVRLILIKLRIVREFLINHKNPNPQTDLRASTDKFYYLGS